MTVFFLLFEVFHNPQSGRSIGNTVPYDHMSMTKEELLHLAKLSRLKIEESEFETLRAQLGEILEYVSRLQAVEIPVAQETGEATLAVVRPDVPEPSSPELLQELIAAFPDRADQLLRVPGVFDKPKD